MASRKWHCAQCGRRKCLERSPHDANAHCKACWDKWEKEKDKFLSEPAAGRRRQNRQWDESKHQVSSKEVAVRPAWEKLEATRRQAWEKPGGHQERSDSDGWSLGGPQKDSWWSWSWSTSGDKEKSSWWDTSSNWWNNSHEDRSAPAPPEDSWQNWPAATLDKAGESLGPENQERQAVSAEQGFFSTASGTSCSLGNAIDILEDIHRHIQLDSFALAMSKQITLFEIENEFSKGYRAGVNLFRIGVDGASVHVLSDWKQTEESAKQHAAWRAVKVLHEMAAIDDEFRSPGKDKVEKLRGSSGSPDAVVEARRGESLSFEMLYDSRDLSDPLYKWPEKMQVRRIRVSSKGEEHCSFGLLMPSPVDEQHPLYGVSLEWLQGVDGHSVTRFEPCLVDWSSLKKASDWQGDAENLLCRYHECVIHDLFPALRPEWFDLDAVRLPTPALLVQLVPAEWGAETQLAWSQMASVVSREQEAIMECIYREEDEADCSDEEPCLAEMTMEAPAAWDVFLASDAPSVTQLGEDSLPPWLASLLHRWFRLYDLEVFHHRYSPVLPIVSPLLMEAALTRPSSCILGLPFDALKTYGKRILEMLVSITVQEKNPAADEQVLREMTDELLSRERLAQLLANTNFRKMVVSKKFTMQTWTPPGVRCRKVSSSSHDSTALESVSNDECLDQVVEALIGAYALSEGGLFSAWKFYNFLQISSPLGEDSEQTRVEPVLSYLVFGRFNYYKGRTPTYDEFYEIEIPGQSGPEKVLCVHYEECGWAEYRRPIQGLGSNRRFPQERFRDGADGTRDNDWHDVRYSPVLGTCISLYMPTVTGERRPLPNKVNSWFFGQPTMSLVKVKTYSDSKAKRGDPYSQMIEYLQMVEVKDGQLSQLRVHYRTLGWYCYIRSCDGGLGIERKEDSSEGMGIIYSEAIKTLKSPHLKRPLPNRVVDFLVKQKCLALMVCSTLWKAETSDDSAENPNMQMESEDDNSACWNIDAKRSFMCWVDRVPGGVIFMEREKTESQAEHVKEPLCYSEVAKTWLSPALIRLQRSDQLTDEAQAAAALPAGILEWLKRRTEIAYVLIPYSIFRNHYLTQPWYSAPGQGQIRSIPHMSTIAPIAGKLQYDFNSWMLPLEALTHASFSETITPSCERFALLGASLTEILLMELLMDNMLFLPEVSRTLGTTIKSKDGRPPPSQSFTVAWWPNEEKEWPPMYGHEGISQHSRGCHLCPAATTEATTVLEWLSACCNHIAYAYCCVHMELHKHILSSSSDLDAGISSFAQVVRRADRGDPSQLWRTLVQHDAPRVLSDVFQALVGAVFLDGNIETVTRIFKPILKNHILDNVFKPELIGKQGGPLPLALAHAPYEGLEARCTPVYGVDFQDVLETARDAASRRTFCIAAIEDPAAGDAYKKKQHDQIAALRDFHLSQCWRDTTAIGPLTCAASPRSAMRRSVAVMLPGPDINTSDAGTPEESAVDEKEESRPEPDQEGVAVYCEECDMWLNGPTQWEDHKVGKKHKKNMKKTSAGVGGSQQTAAGRNAAASKIAAHGTDEDKLFQTVKEKTSVTHEEGDAAQDGGQSSLRHGWGGPTGSMMHAGYPVPAWPVHYPNWQMPMQPMHYPTQSYGTEAAWSSSADEQQGPWNYIPMDYGAYPEPVNYSRSENYQ